MAKLEKKKKLGTIRKCPRLNYTRRRFICLLPKRTFSLIVFVEIVHDQNKNEEKREKIKGNETILYTFFFPFVPDFGHLACCAPCHNL